MAKNITLMRANYTDVPAVMLPQTGGGNAVFVDADEMGDIEEAVAIVVNGDNAPKAITSGQYLFIKNHSTLATGGYHATANIASGDLVTSSNTALDADGICNSIQSKLTDNANIVSRQNGNKELISLAYVNMYLTDVLPLIPNAGNIYIAPIFPNYSGSMTDGGRGILIEQRLSDNYAIAFIICAIGIKYASYANGTWTWR